METHLSLRKGLITVLDKTRFFALPLILRGFCFGVAGLATQGLPFNEKPVSFLRESSL